MLLLEIQGIEADWLACDQDDCLGFFSSAGSGLVHPAATVMMSRYEAIIAQAISLPVCTIASGSMVNAVIDTWRLMAERGWYAYDADTNGGPYERVSTPMRPARLSELPGEIANLVRLVRFRGVSFSNLASVAATDLEAP
jgi:hypothetical protein